LSAEDRAMRVQPRPNCVLCGLPGRLLYEGLRDRFFDTPGSWNLRECPSATCGAAWLDPMPLEEDIGEAYNTYHAHEATPDTPIRRLRTRMVDFYIRHRLGYAGPRAHRFAAGLLAALYPGGRAELGRAAVYLDGPADGRRFLEIGWGRGDLLLTMKELGWTVEGIDFDPTAVEVARSRGLAVERATIFSHRLAAGLADAVSLVHVVEHVFQPQAVFARCREILKPGGTLVVITPNFDSLGRRSFGSSWVHLDPPRHVTLFRAAALRGLAESAGLVVSHCGSTAVGARSVPVLSRAIRARGRGGVFGRGLGTGAHLLGVPFQFLERALSRLGWNAGEELLLVARRPEE
jgi:2-polyprenyl-3-methyl-5-hydroxy-6-metoxy-1,4-benzoquinol methylase